MISKARQRGFTLFELAVVAIVLGLLATVLLSRLAYYQEQAQRAAVAQMLGVLRTSLRVQALHLYLQGKQSQLPGLQRQNPLDWLEQRPPNDLGELLAPDVEKLPSGNWFFDRSDQKLGFLLRTGNIFSPIRVDVMKFKVLLPNIGADAGQLASVPDIAPASGPDAVTLPVTGPAKN
ncbi:MULTISPECIES: type II secretion system protein [unclassified Janthinobacterium]|uniref:type II secretion system protein n=1 Tax=unclassified Janthinobacterium TaxID=2610881 RepID=UPI0016179E10|nr:MULTISPECIES: type II secretion system protein [unclassified Janthinobacterium]MBB5609549.1 general secretion pathway protein G [Janthinobacterium sp. S3T4]MBB5614604.1 general secretion pathway protein G [Janthinobacterium sp. S3M3]